MKLVTASFLPLLDASILIIAREKGFAEALGIDLRLSREVSWANVRDRMAIGHFDVAHMLAPMPLASNLGLTPISERIIAPMALGSGGNAVTVSKVLSEALDLPVTLDDPAEAGTSLRKLIAARKSNGDALLRFAVVHPHSSHFFELRYWLAACGIDPETEIDTIVLPPPYMADALKRGTIDGYCVGEPYNTAALEAGDGVLLTTKNAIWRNSPEKVLGVREDWADDNPQMLGDLLRALYRSAEWCGTVANRRELAAILSSAHYLNSSADLLEAALAGPAGFEPFAHVATYPWQSHALWFYSQMVRWGQVEHTAEHAFTASRTFRPDIYRDVLAAAGAPVPSANAKVEGALVEPTPVGAGQARLILGPDGFFDGRIFDPEALDRYIDEQKRARS